MGSFSPFTLLSPHDPIPKPSFIITQRRRRIRLQSFSITVAEARTILLPIPHGALWRPGAGQTLMVHTSARLAVPAQRCLVGAWGEFRCKMCNNILKRSNKRTRLASTSDHHREPPDRVSFVMEAAKKRRRIISASDGAGTAPEGD
jgi:hypothetical protein